MKQLIKMIKEKINKIFIKLARYNTIKFLRDMVNMISYSLHDDINRFIIEKKIVNDMPLTINEARGLYRLVSQIDKKGTFLEIGTYKGGSAAIICKARKGKNMFYCFDTFKGLDNVGKFDYKFDNGMYKGDKERVEIELNDYKNTKVIEGYFPSKEHKVKDIIFAHIDVDTYESTKEVLKGVLPDMKKEGVILIHDYGNTYGVRKAVKELKLLSIEYVGSYAILKEVK